MSDANREGAGGPHEALRDRLMAAKSGAVIDLVWDESLDIGADADQLDSFLGVAKYQPLLEDICRGLGIPAHLLKPEAPR